MLLSVLCKEGELAESLSGCGLCEGVDGTDLDSCRVGGDEFDGEAFVGMRDTAGVSPAEGSWFSTADMVVVIGVGSIRPSLSMRNVIRLGQ
jgi:hypothetical protein